MIQMNQFHWPKLGDFMGLLAFVLLVFLALWIYGYERRKKKRDKFQPRISQEFRVRVLSRERNGGMYLVLELLEHGGQQIRWRVDAKDYAAYRIGEETTIKLYSRDRRTWYSSADWEIHEGVFGEMFDLYTLGKCVPQKFQIV
ncbi:MAG: hypothetical protein HY506_00155 [Candidatus Yanofskybacteria bacterium]|nr:hypothetical protein [Candidatus Yanofskybacteria bacterium]